MSVPSSSSCLVENTGQDTGRLFDGGRAATGLRLGITYRARRQLSFRTKPVVQRIVAPSAPLKIEMVRADANLFLAWTDDGVVTGTRVGSCACSWGD
jgi:hypothetical protein